MGTGVHIYNCYLFNCFRNSATFSFFLRVATAYGVKPLLFVMEISAPFEQRYFAVHRISQNAASCNGVLPSTSLKLTSSLAAVCVIKYSRDFASPNFPALCDAAAACNGLFPSRSSPWTSAPYSTHNLQRSLLFCRATKCRHCCPLQPGALISAPYFRRI